MSDKKLTKSVKGLIDATRISPKALISMIYGDALVPHGGTVWLGSLVKLAKLFGVVEYLSRTSALRLAYDGWLHPTRIGKLSFYSMTDEHVRRLKDNFPRVYSPPMPSWSGKWHLLLTGAADLDRKALAELRHNLRWHGVGQLAPHVYISAAGSLAAIEVILNELNLRDRVEVMLAEPVLPRDTRILRTLVQGAWDIEAIAQRYESFLQKFRPVWLAIASADAIEPEAAFLIRTLLMIDYRSITLQDPRLPQELLPEPWAGVQAFTLAKSIYQAMLGPSEAYLKEVVRTADGPLGEAGESLYSRFGGLERPAAAPAAGVASEPRKRDSRRASA